MKSSNINESNYTRVYTVDSEGATKFQGKVSVPTKKISVRCSFPHRKYKPMLKVSRDAMKKLKAFKRAKKNQEKLPTREVYREFFKRVDREFIDRIEEMQTSW